MDATLLNSPSSPSYHNTYRAVPVRDHSFYGPPMRSLSLWMQSPVSCSTGESLSSPALPSLQLPITGQGLFRLVRRRRPWEVRELPPPVLQIHSSLARHLSICSFLLPYPTEPLFDVPFHLLHPTHTIVYPNTHYSYR